MRTKTKKKRDRGQAIELRKQVNIERMAFPCTKK